MASPLDALPPQPLAVHAVEHEVWCALQASLQQALQLRGLHALVAPTSVVLHDLLDGAVAAMHRSVFRRIVESDFGLRQDAADPYPEELYQTEIAEHGAENIARYCREHGWQISVSYPREEHELVRLDLPVAWDGVPRSTTRLMQALGYRLDVQPGPQSADGQRLRLMLETAGPRTRKSAVLLDGDAAAAGVAAIFDKLDYALIRFSGSGDILAVSPSLFARLRMRIDAAAANALAAAIPANFFNDIVWGVALEDDRGVFENYRIRIRLPQTTNTSLLFNVSGFRDDDGCIQSLWQAVSFDEGDSPLSEGSMLSEVRVHKITRNYVPQLVEQKARDAVRLGKNKLSNEVRSVAVLFCDIVGFTSYVETNADSESVIDTLNSILRRVANCVKRNRGSIDKFMGDCVMALFDHPADALRAACEMQGHSQDINALRDRAGQQPLQLRIGVHWGEVVIGNVGTVERLDWTAIGDVVNTASRIEKGCRPGSILISQSIRDAVPPDERGAFAFDDVFRLQVKGKWEELAVCYVSASPAAPGA